MKAAPAIIRYPLLPHTQQGTTIKRRSLFPLVIVTVLALSACAGGAPANPESPSPPPTNSSNPPDTSTQHTETPSGAEATVIIGDHVYEFSSDPALTWGKVMPVPCVESLSTLQINLWLVAIDGEAAEELDGSLTLQASDPANESKNNQVLMNITSAGIEYAAGAALNIVDVQDQPVTLTRDGYTISGSQDVYNKVYDAPEPLVVTAQIDARCVDF